MKKHTLFVFSILVLLASCVAPETQEAQTVSSAPTDNPMIHADGTRIVDGTGKPIKLRGVLLEGWLQWNGTLFGAGLTSEKTINERLETLVGKYETNRFREGIYSNFITEKDIASISELGFNVVRIPFNHTILEDDDKPFVYKESGWKHLDNVLDWCGKNKVYAVLDFHSLPGGQSVHFTSDPDSKKFWESEKNLRRTVALWKAIAKRYSDREIVAGYDLINEPGMPKGKTLIDAYVEIIKAIREVDKQHMIILEGGEFASTDFSMFDKPLDGNQVLSFHTYNLFGNDVDKNELRKFTKMSKDMNIPIWNGEFGAHRIEWVRDAVQYFEEPDSSVNGWVFWPWKRVAEANRDRYRTLMEIKTTPKWDKVRFYCASLFGWGKKPTRAEALAGMNEFLESVKHENLLLDKQMLKVLKPDQPEQ